MRPLRYAIFAALFCMFIIVLTLVARTGQVDVSSIRPTAAPVAPTAPAVMPTRRPVLLDIGAFTVAMNSVSTQFTALAQDTNLLTNEAWRRQTLSAMESAEQEARALIAAGHPKREGLEKAAEALRVTRESLVDYDLMGMASGARLMETASKELR